MKTHHAYIYIVLAFLAGVVITADWSDNVEWLNSQLDSWFAPAPTEAERESFRRWLSQMK
jgi:hypothetical protein